MALLGTIVVVAFAAASGALESDSFTTWCLRIVGTMLGSLLVIYGLFTVPGDHKRYENYLVQWWLWVEEKHENGLKWQTAFLQVITAVTAASFDRIFGPKILSWPAAGASAAFSIGSVSLLNSLDARVAYESAWRPTLPLAVALGPVVLVIGSVVVGLMRIITPRLVRYQFILACALLPLFYFSLWRLQAYAVYGSRVNGILLEATGEELIFIAVFSLSASLLTDIAFVVLTRRLLRLAITRSAEGICLLILLNVLVAFAACAAPITIGEYFVEADRSRVANYAVEVIGIFNIFDTVIAVVVLLVAAVMLLHRIVWPPLGRLLQVIHDEHVLLKRGRLLGTGVGILCATWPVLSSIASLFGVKVK